MPQVRFIQRITEGQLIRASSLKPCVTPENHGKQWTPEDAKLLTVMFCSGHKIGQMATDLGRLQSAVIVKLRSLSLGEADSRDWSAISVSAKAASLSMNLENAANQTQTTNPEEPEMTKAQPTIKTVTMIHGRDASEMSDAEIFKLIASIEMEISKLSAIKAQSKKLKQAIEALEADVTKLVEYVDNRDD